jgi:hypothetical protein
MTSNFLDNPAMKISKIVISKDRRITAINKKKMDRGRKTHRDREKTSIKR